MVSESNGYGVVGRGSRLRVLVFQVPVLIYLSKIMIQKKTKKNDTKKPQQKLYIFFSCLSFMSDAYGGTCWYWGCCGWGGPP
jgi:hypothetical protein